MNARQFLSSSKALTATALLALAGAAQAGGVQWTVGVDAPIQGPGRVQAVVSNGRYYAPQPVVYVQPAPVYYAPRPMPVVYEAPRFGGWGHERWHHRHHHHGRAEAYRRGYERGYDQGRDEDRGDRDDRRGGWNRHHH